MLQSDNQELFRVCYSCHCSFRELEHFIKYLKPRQIEACVIPPNMKEEDILQLLKEVSRWENGLTDAPVLTVSSRKDNEKMMSADKTTFCSTRHAEQQNMTTSHNDTLVKEANGGNLQNERVHVDAEIYRLIAEDLKPKIGDPDADIKESISLEFLESAASLNKSLVRENC